MFKVSSSHRINYDESEKITLFSYTKYFLFSEILFDLKKLGVMRNEPVLVVGGGVIADIAGFACALFHRNTPYVMLATSIVAGIVAGIDAGPSPRTCCDRQGYKNAFRAFHPPVVTLTDRTL